ncbi:hypothetical protein D9M71_332480 [compost metagenome]
MVSADHWRGVGVDIDHQVGAAQVAIVVTGSETEVLGHGSTGVFRRGVGELAGIHVHQQGTALDGFDVEGIGCRIERAAIDATGAVAALALRVIGIGRPVDQQCFDKAAIGAERAAAHQAAGNGRTLHRTGQHLIQRIQVGNHHSVGIGMRAAVIRQRVEIAGVDAVTQANGVGLDPVAVEEGLPGSLVVGTDAL